MIKWKVTLTNGETIVEATDVVVTASGALTFITSGVVQHVYAPGHWVNAVLQEGARHGYL